MNNLPLTIIDKVDIGILVIDGQFNIVIWNTWLERFTGRQKEETLGQSVFDICPRFKEKRYLEIFNNALTNGQSRFCSSSLHKNFITPLDPSKMTNKQNMQVEPIILEEQRMILIQVTDVTGHQSRVSQLKNILRVIEIENEQIKAAESYIREKSLHDALTGLPNRVLLYDRIMHEIDSTNRRGNMMALMFLDMDGFKTINDTYGHDAGDKLLQAFAARIGGCIRQSDTMARIGGDEFVILLPDINNKEDVLQVGRKIRDCCKKPYEIDKQTFSVTVSIGISLYPEDGKEIDTLLKKADSAMYTVKASGKNDLAFFL